MKKTNILLALATCSVIAFTNCGKKGPENEPPVDANTGYTVPYTVQLIERSGLQLPNLHSFTHATYKDKIILLGGRRRGLHTTNYNFNQDAANKIIYVVDTKSWSADPSVWTVDSITDVLAVPTITSTNANPLPCPLNGQFRANNAEFFSDETHLYIIGGILGKNELNTTGPYTLPFMTSIDMAALVTAVQNHQAVPASKISQFADPNLAITGGEVGLLNDTVYLTFGWNYNNQFGGEYTHRISTLTYTVVTTPHQSDSLIVNFNQICQTCTDGWNTTSNNGNYRRRDGSMSAMTDPSNGNPCFLYYSGVFKNGNTNWDTPVWINSNSANEDTSFHMRGNVYTCQVLAAYSKNKQESYATLLGGMSNVKFPANSGAAPLLLNNQNAPFYTPDFNNITSVPFTNRLTTIKIDRLKKMWQYLLPDSFPLLKYPTKFPSFPIKGIPDTTLPAGSVTFNGAEAEILWTIPQKYLKSNGVVDYDSYISANPNGGTVGYLYGGILSRVPNDSVFVNLNPLKYSVASNRIFDIKIVPVK